MMQYAIRIVFIKKIFTKKYTHASLRKVIEKHKTSIRIEVKLKLKRCFKFNLLWADEFCKTPIYVMKKYSKST